MGLLTGVHPHKHHFTSLLFFHKSGCCFFQRSGSFTKLRWGGIKYVKNKNKSFSSHMRQNNKYTIIKSYLITEESRKKREKDKTIKPIRKNMNKMISP